MTRRNLFAGAALLAAGVGFFLTPGWGAFLGLIAVLLGVLGFLRSVAPRFKGGRMSLAAVGLGVILIVVKIIAGALRALA
jgi:hypothetical protein